MTISCPNCGAPNPESESLCQSCGLVLPPMLLAARAEMTRPEISTTGMVPVIRSSGPSSGAVPVDFDPADNTPRASQHTQPELKRAKPAPITNGIAMPAPREAGEIPIDAPQLRIGYDSENDLVIPRPMVSGFHARLALVEKRYVLEDLQSTNGTTVNGHRVTRCWVNPGDSIAFGSYTFTLNQEVTQRLLPDDDHRPTQAIAISSSMLRPIVIGREPDCDIVLDAPQISRHHVRITWAGNGWRVEDLDSANGLFVNERTHAVKTALVQDDDVLFFGSYRFPVNRLRDFLDPNLASSDAGHMPLPTDKDVIAIGRGQDNDIVIDAPQISRHHARLIRSNGELWLEDLDSANGTFVEGQRIKRAQVDPEQMLSFGSYAVRLDMARGAIQRSYRGDILLQAENLRVEIKAGASKVRILDGISFTVYPTEFMGLMGPSGSGKTTLLMSLIGYLKPNYGRTLINGDDLGLNYDRYRGAIGYVPQDDIIHHQLTVYEALYYTAKLRLPPDTSDEEIERRIMQVLVDLEIEQTRGLRIGTPEQKGISGGQRKRVNLALELLTEPSLLCLDEPTSGLASEDALNVMRLLRKLADGGRTILLTVHQPAPQAYRLLDNVLYLAEGEQVYYGPAFPDSLFYFNPEIRPGTPEAETLLSDPGNCMRPIVEAARAGEPMETFAARFRQSRYHAEYVEDRKKNRAGVAVTNSGTRKKPRFSMRQWYTLCRRYLAAKIKDRMGMVILLVQAPIIALLLNMVFASEAGGVMSRLQFAPYALFLLVISAIWFGCSNASREVVGEQAIFRRERMVNLSVLAYVLSKFAVLGVLCLLQCATLLLLTYFALDFWGNPIYHLSILWLSAMCGVGMGLFLSSIVRTTEASMALVPLLLIPQVILGGAIMPVAEMNTPTRILAHTTISRWAFEGVLQAEHLADAYEMSADEFPKPLGPGLPAPPPPPNPLDRFFDDAETRLNVDVAVKLAIMFLTLFGVVAVLRIREN